MGCATGSGAGLITVSGSGELTSGVLTTAGSTVGASTGVGAVAMGSCVGIIVETPSPIEGMEGNREFLLHLRGAAEPDAA